jgi:hypothetical protein
MMQSTSYSTPLATTACSVMRSTPCDGEDYEVDCIIYATGFEYLTE